MSERKNIKCELDEFIRCVDGLRNLVRYKTAPRAAKESVAEHSFFVAAYVLKLHDYYNFDLKKGLRLALLHDFSKVFVSDVPHLIKKKFPAVSEELEKAERKVNEEYIGEEFADELEEFNQTSSIEGIIVYLADILSIASYANRERYMSLLIMAEPYLRKDECGNSLKTPTIIKYIEEFMVSQHV